MLVGGGRVPAGLVICRRCSAASWRPAARMSLNCYIDRDIDALMSRTKKRGTVTGRISPRAALIFGLTLSVERHAAARVRGELARGRSRAAGNLYYVLVYTRWLKRRTPQNIVIGGAAGAMPPVVGWAAATGELSVAAVLMFAIIYYWTPPHFWALALLKQGEYGRAAVPMLPVVAGEGRDALAGAALHADAGRGGADAGAVRDGLDLPDRRADLQRRVHLVGGCVYGWPSKPSRGRSSFTPCGISR